MDTVFKEASDFSEAMRCKFLEVREMLVFWIISTNCNDFIIPLSLCQYHKFVSVIGSFFRGNCFIDQKAK